MSELREKNNVKSFLFSGSYFGNKVEGSANTQPDYKTNKAQRNKNKLAKKSRKKNRK